jgi:hypothetical protein
MICHWSAFHIIEILTVGRRLVTIILNFDEFHLNTAVRARLTAPPQASREFWQFIAHGKSLDHD